MERVAGPVTATIVEDVPCVSCGYDLRGLTPPGVCPECGFDLAESMNAYQFRPKPLPPPDPLWARQIREGGWLWLMSFAFFLIPIIAPIEWFKMPFR